MEMYQYVCFFSNGKRFIMETALYVYWIAKEIETYWIMFYYQVPLLKCVTVFIMTYVIIIPNLLKVSFFSSIFWSYLNLYGHVGNYS